MEQKVEPARRAWRRAALGALCACGAAGALGGCDRATSGARVPAYERPQIALVVIDAQKQYLAPGSAAAAPPAQVVAALERLNRAIDGARPGGVQVVYVRSEAPERGWLAGWWGSAAPLRGAPGAPLDPRVHEVGESVVVKERGDAFSAPGLGALLADAMVDHLVLAGADNGGGVRLTAAGARNRGFKVQVLADAVVAASDRERERTLGSLRERGVEISDSERAIAEWARRKRYLASR